MNFFNNIVLIILTSTILSSIGISIILKIANSKKIGDFPNERSLHSHFTPNLGGVPIVLIFLLYIIIFYYFDLGNSVLVLTILVSTLVIFFVGLFDDINDLKPIIRVTFHFFIAIFLIFLIEPIHYVEIFNFEIKLYILGTIFTILLIIWFINLFNFMDGINGLATFQTITFCSSILFFLLFERYLSNDSVAILIYLLILKISLLISFLPWNFPRARIFMGDSCSGVLGLFTSIILIYMCHLSPKYFWVCLILLALFLVDSTLTLLIRLITKQNIFSPHKTHAYQKAAIKYNSHTYVTIVQFLINVFWLFPISFLVILDILSGFYALLIAYIPIVLLLFKMNAGKL